ncbi:MAG: acyl-CoA thioesterase [Synechococcales cyanobacterium T60_A2020_003]|nr:acyl-CoA thioesterase [Synechococcales cyanobacterium T60_A2020_003]
MGTFGNSYLNPMASSVSQPGNLRWFEYRVQAHPHYTDYGGIVWHGSYIAWMEEARVECLRSLGTEFSDCVDAGCDLPVIDLTIRYHQPIQHGKTAIVKTRPTRTKGVRLLWDYRIESPDGKTLYTTAQVTLVAIDRARRTIIRILPQCLEDLLDYFAIPTDTP